MRMISELSNKTQVILWELKNKLPLSILKKETGLSEDQIIEAAKGTNNIEIFTQLLMLKAYLDAQEDETREVLNILTETEMRSLPPMSFCNDQPYGDIQ